MRMVAEELGVTPMAAYRHVPTREALVAWVADEMSADVQVPHPESGTWDERLRELERAAFRAGAALPGWPPTTMATAGPNHRRIVDGVLAILTEAGFNEEDAAVAFEVIWAYFEGQLRIYSRLTTMDDDEPDYPLRRLWPDLARVMKKVPTLSPDDFFDRGFEILLDGLRCRIPGACETPNRIPATTDQ